MILDHVQGGDRHCCHVLVIRDLAVEGPWTLIILDHVQLRGLRSQTKWETLLEGLSADLAAEGLRHKPSVQVRG
jgi:hypothetical protein